jgi:hypothetical protein
MSTKLHQVLAVEDDLRTKSNMILQEAKKTFSSKGDHFDALTKTYTPIVDGGTQIAPEIKELVTTVKDKLDFTLQSVIASIDAKAVISETNSSNTAKAELVIGGKSFGFLSATSLLDIEKGLVNIRQLLGEIPTLDPTKRWTPNGTSVPNTYITAPAVSFRTEKTKKSLIQVPATDKFPAQATVYDDEQQVGKYETVYVSGKITPTQKSELLANADILILAVKDARCRANNVEIVDVKIGQQFVDFIIGSII